jgi:hypothetical protein
VISWNTSRTGRFRKSTRRGAWHWAQCVTIKTRLGEPAVAPVINRWPNQKGQGSYLVPLSILTHFAGRKMAPSSPFAVSLGMKAGPVRCVRDNLIPYWPELFARLINCQRSAVGNENAVSAILRHRSPVTRAKFWKLVGPEKGACKQVVLGFGGRVERQRIENPQCAVGEEWNIWHIARQGTGRFLAPGSRPCLDRYREPGRTKSASLDNAVMAPSKVKLSAFNPNSLEYFSTQLSTVLR